MNNLNDMMLFVEVAKTLSFRQAAEITGIPNSTLSRRISGLEEALGLRLLHRTTRTIELTEAGQIYYERCRHIVEEAKLVHEELGEIVESPRGLLRASLPVDFAINFITPLLGEFAELYPDITFEFDLTPRRVNLVTEPFDVAIRMGEQKDSTLVARRLATLTTSLYAAPSYIEKVGKPIYPAELIDYDCIGFVKDRSWKLYSRESAEMVEASIKGRFFVNNVGMIKELALKGHGIVQLPEEIVKNELEVGRLQQILPNWRGESTSVYAITETRLLPAKTRRFIDFLREHLERKH